MSDEEERWLPIPGYEGRYEVSNIGRVRSLERMATDSLGRQIVIEGRSIKTPQDAGYPHCGLTAHTGRRKTWKVHQLVLLAFVGPRPAGAIHIRHLNGDPTDCRVANLAYGTASQNAYDRVRHGTHNESRKTHCKRGHEFTAKNTYLSPQSGGRVCEKCRMMRQRKEVERRPIIRRPRYDWACPTCSAPPGKHCRSLGSGQVTETHSARRGVVSIGFEDAPGSAR